MVTGGCRCGAIRYEVTGDLLFSGLCHCIDCRKSSGAPMVGWALYHDSALSVTGTPNVHASSPGVERRFCGDCGTPLFFYADYMEGIVDITIGSMDDPMQTPPTAHIWHSMRIGWMDGIDTLERHAQLPEEDLV